LKFAAGRRISQILEILGLDLRDDSLAETPQRIARTYIEKIFSGLDYRNFPKLSVIENKMKVDEMVKARSVMDANRETTTKALGGGFKAHPDTRKEFLMNHHCSLFCKEKD
jgi:GTP cyclohydrolase I